MNLLRALATISSMTLLSRILGFVRDFVIARIFGAGVLTDAFFVAFKLPNLLRRLFAEGAFSQAFVPILGEYKNKRGESEAKRLVDHVATLLFLITLVVTLLGMLAAPAFVYISAPGFAKDAEKYLEAALAGWTVLRLTERQLEIDTIERIVALLNTPRAAGCRSMTGPIP